MKKTMIVFAVLAIAAYADVKTTDLKKSAADIARAYDLDASGKSIEAEKVRQAALKELRKALIAGSTLVSAPGCEWQRLSASEMRPSCIENFRVELALPGQTGSAADKTDPKIKAAKQSLDMKTLFNASVRITVKDDANRGARQSVEADGANVVVYGQLTEAPQALK